MTQIGTFSPMTDVDALARKQGKPRIIDAPASALPEAEYTKLMDGPAERRIAFRAANMDQWFGLGTDPVEPAVTGQQLFDANDGRSPNPDELERNTGGKFRIATQEEQDSTGAQIIEVATGRRVELERPRPRLTVQE